MSFIYEKLWKILVDKNILKTDFAKNARITSATLAKLGKNKNVNMEILDKICNYLQCDIGDIVEYKNTNYLRVVSLFSGIGGIEVAIEKSKIDSKTIFSSEINPQASTSYLANFPNNNLNGDITKISENNIPDHDLLVGGFPCQSFSIAGKRHGFNDTRGTLFFDVARILKFRKPKYVLLENVKNLISHDESRTINTILWSLCELGYTVDFTVINSKESGLPQNRERTYILGILDGKQCKYDIDYRNKKVNLLKNELNRADFKSFNFFNLVKFNNKIRILKDILETNVDEKFYFETKKIHDYLLKNNIKDTFERSSSIEKIIDLPKSVHNDHERQRRVYSINGISPTILARSDTTKIFVSSKNNNGRIRKITPVEAMRAQGFDDDFIIKIRETGVSDTQLYKQAGNAVSPPIIEEILNTLYEIRNGRIHD